MRTFEKATNPKVGTGKLSLMSAQVGQEKLYIFDPESFDEVYKQMRNSAIRLGCRIDWLNGTYTVWKDEEVLDFSKSGVEMYTWHKDGNRNLHTRCRVLIDSKTGDVIESVTERKFYKLMD